MAQSLRDIKDKITSTQNMSKITNAMQMVATAKLAKSESKTKNYRNYMKSLEKLMESVLVAELAAEHPFFVDRGGSKTGYVIFTSDRGLAGGYNSNILKLFQTAATQKKTDEFQVYMIGSKGFDYAKRRQLKIENEYVFVPDELVYNDIKPVFDQVIADYLDGVIDEVVIVYNDYISKILQEPKTYRLLPLQSKQVKKQGSSPIYEPNEKKLIESILPKYVEGTLYGIAITAKISEFASRMNAMQNATDNASDIIDELQLVYNRARQAAITQEINEIVGGAAAI